MAQLGKINRLPVIKQRDFGVYLDGGKLGEILLPKRVAPDHCQAGDELEVMIYLDSEDLLIATTETPKVQVGQCACLEVVALSPVGAFLDWGLPKDLLLPFNEQQRPLKEGDKVVVCVYLDNSNRIAASSKLNRHLNRTPPRYQPHQQVDLLLCERTDLGIKAIVNHRHWGLLFNSDQFQPLRYGQSLQGYIKQVRDDGKISLLHQQPGAGELEPLGQRIIAHLKAQGGSSPLSDKSDAAEISRLFGVSKRKFKQALSRLYKERRILIEETGIRLTEG